MCQALTSTSRRSQQGQQHDQSIPFPTTNCPCNRVPIDPFELLRNSHTTTTRPPCLRICRPPAATSPSNTSATCPPAVSVLPPTCSWSAPSAPTVSGAWARVSANKSMQTNFVPRRKEPGKYLYAQKEKKPQDGRDTRFKTYEIRTNNSHAQETDAETGKRITWLTHFSLSQRARPRKDVVPHPFDPHAASRRRPRPSPPSLRRQGPRERIVGCRDPGLPQRSVCFLDFPY